MNTDLKLALTHLAKGELLQLREGQGKGIAVFDGDAWVTQDSDPQDHILGAGESFALDRPGLAIVQALSDASVLVFDVDTRSAAAAPVSAQANPAATRDRQGPSTAIEWYFEARRQRALAIGNALARGFAALRLLGMRAWTRFVSGASGSRPAVHGQ